MGQNATHIASVGASNVSQPEAKESEEKDFQFLLGKLENLPESARKLFSLGKRYLTTGSRDENGEGDGFCALFQLYESPNSGGETSETISAGETLTPSVATGLFSTPLRKSAPLHHFQTYVQWKAGQDLTNFYSMCLPKRQTIYLQPINSFPDFVQSYRLRSQNLDLNLFEVVQAFLQVFFCGLEVLLLSPATLDAGGGLVRSRVHSVTGSEQLCIDDLYPFLQRLLPPNGLCVMGISWTDLYPEGHNFALGEASVQHRAAAISFGRFETKEFDASTHRDISHIDADVIWKLIKSSSHELCHLLGLQHCTFFRCAMNESSSVREAMGQPLFLCPVCLRKLQRACSFDVLERYALLRKFLSSLAEQVPGDKGRFEESLVWLNKCIDYLNS